VRYRQLGRSGLTVSVVGLGGTSFGKRVDLATTVRVVRTALDLGVTLVDTADCYGDPPGSSEEFLGEALAGRRDEVVLATKFGVVRGARRPEATGSRRYVRRAVEASLRRLGTDHLDLYQYHAHDGVTPYAETLGALDELVREGKIRYAGLSNTPAWRIADAAGLARRDGLAPLVSEQAEYSLLRRGVEAEVVPACLRYGMGLLPYFPLAAGMLTGKFRRGEPPAAGTRLAEPGYGHWLADPVFDRVEGLQRFAADRGLDLLQVAIGGLAAQPAVASVLAGATRPAQVLANVAAADWQPDQHDLAELNRIAP
jgi:aryl-alcohol dehydrogenase-like predicted oxidoreductase